LKRPERFKKKDLQIFPKHLLSHMAQFIRQNSPGSMATLLQGGTIVDRIQTQRRECHHSSLGFFPQL